MEGKKPVSTNIPESLYNDLIDFINRTGATRSKIIEFALRDFFAKYKAENEAKQK